MTRTRRGKGVSTLTAMARGIALPGIVVSLAVVAPPVAAQPSANDASPSASADANAARVPYGKDMAAELGDAAVEANPSVGAINSRIDALSEKVRQSKARLDPTFAAEYSNMPINAPIPGEHPMSGIQLTLRQTFYWPGKVSARQEVARSQVNEAEQSLAERKVQLRAAVERAYYRLALTRQLREVTNKHVAALNDFIDVVAVKNEAGLAAQYELLQLRVLVDQLKDDLKDFDQEEASLTATINATLHRSTDIPALTPERTRVPRPPGDETALARRAEQERPLLQGLAAKAETHRAAARQATREGYPDITLWAGYRVRTRVDADRGMDFVSVGASMPLPLSYRGRWGTERRLNDKLAEAAMQDRAAEVDRIRGELGRRMAEWRRAAQKAQTYRQDLTPEARMTLDTTFVSYQADRADFASLFQAELQLLNFERTTLLAETSAAEARVEVDALVGSEAK